MRAPAKRRVVVALALISQVFAGAMVHVAPAHAGDRAPQPAKHLQTIRDSQVVRDVVKAPCPDHEGMQAKSSAKSDAVKADLAKADVAKVDLPKSTAAKEPTKQDCCKDGTCKCPAATPAAVETRAVVAPAACPAPRADGICEAPPSRLRPSVFFRPPI